MAYNFNSNVCVILILIVSVITLPRLINSESLYSAQVEIESLGQTKGLVIDALKNYLNKEKIRVEEIKERFQPYLERSKKDPQKVAGHPISAFKLIKALTLDLDRILDLTKDKSNYEKLMTTMNEIKQNKMYPTKTDLSGVAIALNRIMTTYKLRISDLVDGTLNGTKKLSKPLSADDCFEIGRLSYQSEDYDNSILWLKEAVKLIQNKSKAKATPLYSELNILDELSWVYSLKGILNEAIRNSKETFAKFPNHIKAKRDSEYYENLLALRNGKENIKIPKPQFNEEMTQKYEDLCNGKQKYRYYEHYHCKMTDFGNPYFKIGPIKEEMLNFAPRYNMYRNIISDNEIKYLKRRALPNLKIATVYEGSEEKIKDSARLAKFAHLEDKYDEVVRKINRRLSLISGGLDLTTANELEIVNYGVGGGFIPRYDFVKAKEVFGDRGNRIATFLLFLSKVKAGGATIFPYLDLMVWPEKGSGIFWANLLRDGGYDMTTKYADCPVIVGSKWVANKWWHERGQEFIWPCDLNTNNQYSYEFKWW